MFVVDLGGNVPTYGQEHCTWCGAATAQMIRNGYPQAADRLFYTQTSLWNTIQVFNSTVPADSNWATDPHGLTGCLQSLANPAGVHWVEFAETNRDAVLFDMLYWMNQRRYPSGVLVNRGGHWVVVVRYVTDVEPLGGTSPALQNITIIDPEPHNVGTISTFSGGQWYAGPWNGGIIYAGTWFNQYVAVVEPPTTEGTVLVEQVRRTGARMIPPDQAVEAALRWVRELELARQPEYAVLEHEEVRPLEPMVVREDPESRRARSEPAYYIIPFGFARERDEGRGMARVCVLVNAYTGAFEEVTAFGRPLAYLGREQALAIVAEALRIDPAELRDADAVLRFRPSDITHIRTYPFWQVKVHDRVVFVDQLGKLYGKLLPSIPGD